MRALARHWGGRTARIEIKDADAFDKHIRGAPCAQRASAAQNGRRHNHARNAHEIRVSRCTVIEEPMSDSAQKGNKIPEPAPKVPHKVPHCSLAVPSFVGALR